MPIYLLGFSITGQLIRLFLTEVIFIFDEWVEFFAIFLFYFVLHDMISYWSYLLLIWTLFDILFQHYKGCPIVKPQYFNFVEGVMSLVTLYLSITRNSLLLANSILFLLNVLDAFWFVLRQGLFWNNFKIKLKNTDLRVFIWRVECSVSIDYCFKCTGHSFLQNLFKFAVRVEPSMTFLILVWDV